MSVSLRLAQLVSLGLVLLGWPVTFVSLIGCPKASDWLRLENAALSGWIQFPSSMDSYEVGEGGTGTDTHRAGLRYVLSWSSVRWRWIPEVGEGSQSMQRNSGQRDVTGDGVMALRDDFWREILEDRDSRKMKHSLQRP